MIKIIVVNNPFEQQTKEYSIDTNASVPVSAVVSYCGLAAEHVECFVDDAPVGVDELVCNDTVFVRVIAAEAATWAFVGKVIFWTFVAVSTIMSIQASIKARKAAKRGFNMVGDGMDAESPTYTWDGISSTQESGQSVKIVYGTHRIGGNVINAYTSSDGEKNYLALLFAMCEGEVSGISSVVVNNAPVANFEGVAASTSMGTNTQGVAAYFGDVHSVQPVGVALLKDAPEVYTTVKTDVEVFEVNLSFPFGLYSQDENTGVISAWTVEYTVEYKLHTDGSYTSLGTQTVNTKSRATFSRTFRKEGLAPGQYDIRVTRTSGDSTDYDVGDLTLTSVDEITTDDLAYPNTALLSLRLLATDQLSGGIPNVTALVKGLKISAPDVKNGETSVDWENYYWDADAAKYKLISDDTELTWDGSTYRVQYCANPVWCLRDLITNSRYGLGDLIESADIETTDLVTLSRYCDEMVDDGDGGYERRHVLACTIDSQSRALDILSQICATFNAMLIYSNGKVSFRIDKPDTPVMLFSRGNMISGSLEISTRPKKDRPNVVDVTFSNQDRNYEQEMISVTNEASLADGDPIITQNLRVYDSRTSAAVRAGKRVRDTARYVDHVYSWKSASDALGCQPGDVVRISNEYIINAGSFSGHVVEGSATASVKLDRTVTLGAGTYKISVRLADDTIEERTVTNSAGDTDTITVSVAFTAAPAAGDVYCLGLSASYYQDVRVISIQRDRENISTIEAVEYNASVYDDESVTLPDDFYSTPSDQVPGQVSGASYDFSSGLNIVWDGDRSVAGYEVRLNDADWGKDDANLIYRGVERSIALNPASRSPGTYYIRAFNASGVYSTTSTTLVPTNAAPATPTVDVNVFFNVARISWADSQEPDVMKYEVYRSETDDWAGEETLVASAQGTSAMLEGNSPRGSVVDSSSDTTVVCEDLIGFADDYFNGDRILITSGTGEGQSRYISDFNGTTGEITVSAAWDTNPANDDECMIQDRCFVKVRAVDIYGAGSFSVSKEVQYENLDENALGDNVILARKIYVATLSALSANMGELTAGTITGATMQTAASGARTVFDVDGIRSYDDSEVKQFEVRCGNLWARSATFEDPECCCNYSYLDGGALKFHNEFGAVPYVKRLCGGVANSGATICLQGWEDEPKVQVGVQSLDSYKSANSAQDQRWCIYSSTPVYYCNCAADWGYCFTVHSQLTLSSGAGAECTRSLEFNTAYCTAACVCEVCLRSSMLYYCVPAAPSCYRYGTACYALRYRLVGAGTWCETCYSYTQPHASVGEVTTAGTACLCKNFGCMGAWELALCFVSVAWTATTLPYGSSSNCSCCRTFAGILACVCVGSCFPDGQCSDNDNQYSDLSGTNPSNVYCSTLCYCWCTTTTYCLTAAVTTPYCDGCQSAEAEACLRVGCGSTYSSVVNCYICHSTCDGCGCICKVSWNNCALVSVPNCTYSCVRLTAAVGTCIATRGSASAGASVCLLGGYMIQCYTVYSGDAQACCFGCMHTSQDIYGCYCVLDNTGVLNWLAVAYS